MAPTTGAILMMIRFLPHSEYSLYAAHLKRLDDHDRYMRFNYQISDAQIESHVIQCGLADTHIFAFVEDSMAIAAIEVVMSNASAEVGLSVESNFRGQKLGTRLFEVALGFSYGRGARIMYSHCLTHNRFMTRLARSMGMDVKSELGESTGELVLHSSTNTHS
jgi:GNAT superfamily N-acetyltransferase